MRKGDEIGGGRSEGWQETRDTRQEVPLMRLQIDNILERHRCIHKDGEKKGDKQEQNETRQV
jgi:hypothetical protein